MLSRGLFSFRQKLSRNGSSGGNSSGAVGEKLSGGYLMHSRIAPAACINMAILSQLWVAQILADFNNILDTVTLVRQCCEVLISGSAFTPLYLYR